jgi:predicted nucleic acid-binding protein
VVVRRVLDTNAVLYFLGGKLAEPLLAGEFVISMISETEPLSYPLLDASAQAAISDFLSQITIVPLDDDVKEPAIQLRRQIS